MDISNMIAEGKTALGIEFGSTRIKAVLVGDEGQVIDQLVRGKQHRAEGKEIASRHPCEERNSRTPQRKTEHVEQETHDQ